MGMTYCGVYADAIDSYSHEGYAARILPDGTETGSWTGDTDEFVGYRASCGCGWRGTSTYPPTKTGEYEADEDWDHHHLRPLIHTEAQRHTVPAPRLLDLMRDLRASTLMPGEHSRGLLAAADHLEQLLDDLAHNRR